MLVNNQEARVRRLKMMVKRKERRKSLAVDFINYVSFLLN